MSTRRRTRTVVDDVTFTAPAGEITGLLGHNGSGKSTTLRMCAGALRPSSGELRFNGHTVTGSNVPIRRRIGYIPDVGGVFPRLTGWEHTQLAARLFGLARWRDRAGALFEALDLTDAANELAGTYSHGMSRKLSAVIALLPAPDLLLADEPFDGVDADGVATISDALTAAAAAGATVLLATHLLDVADNICATKLHLAAGRITSPRPL